MVLRHLEEAERHVEQGNRHIAEQKQWIEELSRDATTRRTPWRSSQRDGYWPDHRELRRLAERVDAVLRPHEAGVAIEPEHGARRDRLAVDELGVPRRLAPDRQKEFLAATSDLRLPFLENGAAQQFES